MTVHVARFTGRLAAPTAATVRAKAVPAAALSPELEHAIADRSSRLPGFHRLPAAGGTPQQLTFDRSNKTQPSYAPNGQRIALTVWEYAAHFWVVK